jgi:hypothetical protein
MVIGTIRFFSTSYAAAKTRPPITCMKETPVITACTALNRIALPSIARMMPHLLRKLYTIPLKNISSAIGLKTPPTINRRINPEREDVEGELNILSRLKLKKYRTVKMIAALTPKPADQIRPLFNPSEIVFLVKPTVSGPPPQRLKMNNNNADSVIRAKPIKSNAWSPV